MMTLSSTSWIQYWQPKPQARVRLFCFPYAGGTSGLFRTWSEQFPPDIEVYPIQLPGRERRIGEIPFRWLPDLIEALIEVLAPYLDKPYAIFGHSMGALIGFELSRSIRQMHQGLLPVHLFLSGHRAPQIALPRAPAYNLPEADFIDVLSELNGTPKETLQHKELLQLLLPLLRADFEVCETYQYKPEQPLTCPITVLGGVDDSEVTPTMLEAWKKQTSGPFKLHLFDGDHFYIHNAWPRVIATILQELSYATG
jgi:medium-chain acyl-[acyl-carrier-protein] hydrolase